MRYRNCCAEVQTPLYCACTLLHPDCRKRRWDLQVQTWTVATRASQSSSMLRVQRDRSREEGPRGEASDSRRSREEYGGLGTWNASDSGRSQEEFSRPPHVEGQFSLQRSTSCAMYQKQHINGAARSYLELIRIEVSNEEEDRASKDLWE